MESKDQPKEPNFPKEVTVRLAGPDGQPGPLCKVPMVRKTDAEWRQQLDEERYQVLRRQGTEPPFCGQLLEQDQGGIYLCAGCHLPLFTSGCKFHSGTGWPSFCAPFAKENILERSDRSHGVLRTEILCTRCKGHLGHVFPDGPPPTGLRYCLNSLALLFQPQ